MRISAKKEAGILAHLRQNAKSLTKLSYKVIARDHGVSDHTVARLHQIQIAADSAPAKLVADIKRLLLAGEPIVQISMQQGVSEQYIKDLARVGLLKPDRNDFLICSKCGKMILPAVDPAINGCRRKKYRGKVTKQETVALCDIVLDILNLDALCLIANPLFFDLARRAEGIYDKLETNRTKKTTISR